jgi:hypothetical protein
LDIRILRIWVRKSQSMLQDSGRRTVNYANQCVQRIAKSEAIFANAKIRATFANR